MNNINRITICRDSFESHQDFEEAILRAIKVLLENDYIMVINYDEKGLGIINIEYNHSNQEYGCDYPYWLSPNEIESVVFDDKEDN